MKRTISILGILGLAVFLVAANISWPRWVEDMLKPVSTGGLGVPADGVYNLESGIGGETAAPKFGAYRFYEVQDATEAISIIGDDNGLFLIGSALFDRSGSQIDVIATTTDPTEVMTWSTPRLVFVDAGTFYQLALDDVTGTI